MSKRVFLGLICLLFCLFPLFSGGQEESQTIKIGLIGPFTGPAVEVGDNIKRAGILAIEEINANGGILGKQIEYVLGDTESKPASGVSVFERLINKDNVMLITGGLHSDVALATMDVSSKYNIPHITNGPVSAEIEGKVAENPERFKYFFKGSPSSDAYGDAWTNFFKYLQEENILDSGKKTIAYIHERTSWGEAIAEKVESCLEDEGWTTVAKEVVSIDASDYLSILSKIKNLDPAVVLVLQTSPAAGASLTKQYRDNEIESLLCATYLPGNPSYVEIAGDAAEGVTWNVVPAVIPSLEITQKFEKAFKERWDCDASPLNAAIQYSLMYIIQAAYEKAGSFDPDAFAEAFLDTDFMSPIGKYRFSETTHAGQAGMDLLPVLTYQIKDGQSSIVWPETYAQSELEF